MNPPKKVSLEKKPCKENYKLKQKIPNEKLAALILRAIEKKLTQHVAEEIAHLAFVAGKKETRAEMLKEVERRIALNKLILKSTEIAIKNYAYGSELFLEGNRKEDKLNAKIEELQYLEQRLSQKSKTKNGEYGND